MTKYVVILGSLGTKAVELAFLRRAILAEGGYPQVMDSGVWVKPAIEADISREQVADAAGSSIGGLIRADDKEHSLTVMAKGAAKIMEHMLRNDELAGVISIGDSRGTLLGTRAMLALPVGVPKLMISNVASGQLPFGPYFGTKDITIMHSVADIWGINPITQQLLTNAAAAIVAMSHVGRPVSRGEKGILAVTVLGSTTSLVERIRSLVEENFELIAFQANGTGGRAMEEFITNRLIDGVFDMSLAELMGWITGGSNSAGPARMRAAGKAGIPQVISPCGLDFIIEEGTPEELPEKYQGRRTIHHTVNNTLVRTSLEELAQAAQLLGDTLAESTAPSAVILPLRGFSRFSIAGQPLHSPEADQAFIQTFKAIAPPHVKVIELDTHLDDPRVAVVAVRLMRNMLAQETRKLIKVDVQLFSTLRECLPPGSEHGRITVSLPNGATLTKLVVELGIDRRLGIKADEFTDRAAWQILINGHPEENMQYLLQHEDLVQVFPPIAGG